MNIVNNKNNVKKILSKVNNCSLCLAYKNFGIDILHKEIGLNYVSNLQLPVKVMFLAESLPKLSNGFFYIENQNSPFRAKLFSLINCSNLPNTNTISEFNKNGYYLADSINCRWDKSFGKYLPVQVLENCSIYLEEQIKLLKPKNIVTMGNHARTIVYSSNIQRIILQNTIKIISMSFILTASNETDVERIQKLNSIIL